MTYLNPIQGPYTLFPRLHCPHKPFELQYFPQIFLTGAKRLSNMRTSVFVRPTGVLFFPRTSFPHSRRRVSFPRKVFLCQGSSGVDGKVSLRVVSPTLLAAEKEEAKATLTLFLKKQGLSKVAAVRTINRSDAFVDHLVSRLHSVHKTRYLVGRELSTLEIREALIPYLETLLEENGGTLVDFVQNFQKPSVEERPEEDSEEDSEEENVVETSVTSPESRKLKALARLTDISPNGKLPSSVAYLLDLGMELEAIREVIRKFPAFAYYSLEGKIKPVVEFLIDLGVPKSNIPSIISKRPQLCGISLTENLIPTMGFLEDLGVDKRQWAKVIYRFPPLLTYSRQKLQATVDFLHEMGLSSENVGSVLTRSPNIVSYSVDEKLRPTAEYFRSLEVDVAVVLYRSPQTFGLSVEANLKPMTEFFLERGYSLKDIATMISKYGALYSFSLTENMISKWEFFLTMDYPKSDLVKFPQYFGYSLEDRIKPRYEMMSKCEVKLPLHQMLYQSDEEFHKLVKKKLKKMLD